MARGKFAREAAAALLRWSRIADRDQATRLIERRPTSKIDLRNRPLSEAGQNSLKAPDIET
jgi:hypothetical protein